VRGLVLSARQAAATTVNTLQVMTNFEIGRRIVEHEQRGAARAEYGKELLKELSARLQEEFGKGFSERNLEYMRKFFLTWRERLPEISQKASAKLTLIGKGQILSGKSPFTLSWSHYVLLLTIKNPEARAFYQIESAQAGWSLPELKRQVASALYERLALSRDKEKVSKLAAEGQVLTRPEDMLKEPYVLEFLGLEEKPSYSETELETAIISHLEHFLLELGKGFLFEARQKRFTFDEDHFFVDLVFYNRLLRCYVIIDLKLDKLTHQDLGQMQMYVNYFDRYVKTPDENPTIGILLCQEKKDAIVELTLPPGTNIHSKELLRKKLLDWIQERGSRERPGIPSTGLRTGLSRPMPRKR
jgi:predicted nuclease of restriction endonuclease-like (RecB) superfamily